MLKILQARLQQYVNCELPDDQAGFRKGRGTRDQIANIRWIIEKARVLEKWHQPLSTLDIRESPRANLGRRSSASGNGSSCREP